MKIQEIEVFQRDLKLRRPYTIAFKEVTKVENGFIRIITDKGPVGLGAMNPSYEIVGETLQDALEFLTEDKLEFLYDRDIRDINQLCYDVQHEFAKSTGARTALEIAIYDLFSQYLEVPLAFYLGQKIISKPTSITIGIKGVEETLEEAEEYIARKFRILKVKLGKTLEEDIERLVKLREKFGDRINIIIDVNQGFSPFDLIRFYKQTEDMNIPLIEQPLPRGQEDSMKKLPGRIRGKLAADESLITPCDADKLVKNKLAYGYFNIKLMKCGGISEALKIADVAYRNKVNLMWGCNDESIISISAALHAAFSCPHTMFIDLDGSLDLAEDVVNGGFVLEDGIMSLNGRPGLGLESL